MQALRDDLTRAGADEREATELAALLERAAGPARFEVTRAELESALARVQPTRRPLRVPRVVLGAAALAAAALVLILVLPSRQEPVQARALSALGGPNTILHLRENLFSDVSGVQATAVRDVWYDPSRGRVAWRDIGEDGIAFAETLVTPKGFDRLIRAGDIHLHGRSCNAIVAGCSPLLDPVARYREVLRRSATRPVRTTYNGRSTYRFVLPLQPGLDQIAYVDTKTFLPRSILWRERGRVVSTIDVTEVDHVERADVPASAFAKPRGGRLVNVAPAGKLVSVRRTTVSAMRSAHIYWLGRKGLRSIVERRYTNRSAFVATYPRVQVWTYGDAVPPELLAPRMFETKTLELNGAPITYFGFDGHEAVVRDGSPSVAAVGTGFVTKEELFAALSRARLLH